MRAEMFAKRFLVLERSARTTGRARVSDNRRSDIAASASAPMSVRVGTSSASRRPHSPAEAARCSGTALPSATSINQRILGSLSARVPLIGAGIVPDLFAYAQRAFHNQARLQHSVWIVAVSFPPMCPPSCLHRWCRTFVLSPQRYQYRSSPVLTPAHRPQRAPRRPSTVRITSFAHANTLAFNSTLLGVNLPPARRLHVPLNPQFLPKSSPRKPCSRHGDASPRTAPATAASPPPGLWLLQSIAAPTRSPRRARARSRARDCRPRASRRCW